MARRRRDQQVTGCKDLKEVKDWERAMDGGPWRGERADMKRESSVSTIVDGCGYFVLFGKI